MPAKFTALSIALLRYALTAHFPFWELNKGGTKSMTVPLGRGGKMSSSNITMRTYCLGERGCAQPPRSKRLPSIKVHAAHDLVLQLPPPVRPSGATPAVRMEEVTAAVAIAQLVFLRLYYHCRTSGGVQLRLFCLPLDPVGGGSLATAAAVLEQQGSRLPLRMLLHGGFRRMGDWSEVAVVTRWELGLLLLQLGAVARARRGMVVARPCVCRAVDLVLRTREIS